MRSAILAALAIVMGLTPPASAQTGVVRGVVEDSSGVPLENAAVFVRGAGTGTVTDARGRFTLGGLAARSHVLVVRRLGFDSLAARIDVQAGDTTMLSLSLLPSVARLAAMPVSATAVWRRLVDVGFDRRRRQAVAVPARQFIARDEIERRNPIALSQMLSRAIGPNRCLAPTMYVDGVLKAPPPKDPPVIVVSAQQARQVAAPPPRTAPIDELPPMDVEGMEIYTGPAQIPPEFKAAGRSAGCVVVLWTR